MKTLRRLLMENLVALNAIQKELSAPVVRKRGFAEEIAGGMAGAESKHRKIHPKVNGDWSFIFQSLLF
jgi:hypothetical protein